METVRFVTQAVIIRSRLSEGGRVAIHAIESRGWLANKIRFASVFPREAIDRPGLESGSSRCQTASRVRRGSPGVKRTRRDLKRPLGPSLLGREPRWAAATRSPV